MIGARRAAAAESDSIRPELPLDFGYREFDVGQ